MNKKFIEFMSKFPSPTIIIDRDPAEDDLEIEMEDARNNTKFKVRIEVGHICINRLTNKCFIAQNIKDKKVKWIKYNSE